MTCKENSGCSPSHITPSPPSCPVECRTLKDSSSEDLTVDTSIGSLSSRLSASSDSEESKTSLAQQYMRSSPTLLRRASMSGKTRRVFPTLVSNLVVNPFVATQPPTGNTCGSTRKHGISWPSPRTRVYYVSGPFSALRHFMTQHVLWNEKFQYFGEGLTLAKVDGHGKKQLWRLTVRILEANFGADTETMKTLLSMNFEEVSTFPISSDGPTVIQSWWKSKEAPYLW